MLPRFSPGARAPVSRASNSQPARVRVIIATCCPRRTRRTLCWSQYVTYEHIGRIFCFPMRMRVWRGCATRGRHGRTCAQCACLLWRCVWQIRTAQMKRKPVIGLNYRNVWREQQRQPASQFSACGIVSGRMLNVWQHQGDGGGSCEAFSRAGIAALGKGMGQYRFGQYRIYIHIELHCVSRVKNRERLNPFRWFKG